MNTVSLSNPGGGFTVVRPSSPLVISEGEEQGILCQSDHHFGSAQADYALISWELEEARLHGDRVLLNGDLFDGILPSDQKRYQSDNLHPRLQGRRDLVNAVVDWAVEVFGPYADLVDLVGVGNHDTTLIDRHSVDPVRLFVDRLQKKAKKGHTVSYGGVTGFIRYDLRKLGTYTIYYHHGAGKGSTLRSVLESLLSRSWAQADLYWEGHRHAQLTSSGSLLQFPKDGPEPVLRPVRYLATGGYIQPFRGQTQADMKRRGPRRSYVTDAALRPQGLGGARVILKHDPERGLIIRILQ